MKKLNLSKPKLTDKDIKDINDFCSFMGYTPKIIINQDNIVKKAIITERGKFVGYIQKNFSLEYVTRNGYHYFIFSREEIDRVQKLVKAILPRNKPDFEFIRLITNENNNNNKSKTDRKNAESIFS